MNDNTFLERLRDEARRLRYDANDVTVSRLATRIRERVAAQPTVAQFLAGWFRPVASALAALALVATLGVQWFQSSREPSLETAMSGGSEISVDGDTYTLAD
jgi:hypothetical protein